VNETQVIDSLTEFIIRHKTREDEFDALALQIFDYQFNNNLPYQRFCRQRETTPKTVQSWKSIPAVPINAYKSLTLSCCRSEDVKRTFMTSGTTGDGLRGKCHHPTLSVYDSSMITAFKARFMPDLKTIRMGILFPTENQMPNSSLAHYLALAYSNFGSDGSQYLLTTEGVCLEKLFAELERAEKNLEPYALLGASYSFVHLIDQMEKSNQTIQLPKGSRILDTGGFKGQSRELDLDDFYERLSERFSVPRASCVNMYGMTELSTQFYDNGNQICPSKKSGPHWIRSQVVNPVTGIPMPKGERGILVHCDLAHFNCVATIQTEDIGIEVDNGFLLLGRAEGAEAKGCSMAVAEFLKIAQG